MFFKKYSSKDGEMVFKGYYSKEETTLESILIL